MRRSAAFVTALALAGLMYPAKAQWMQTSGPPSGSVKKLLLHGGALYAGTQPAEVYKSLDSGKTWHALPLAPRVSSWGAAGSGVFSMAGMGRFIYAGTLDSLQRSGDGGKTWERSNKGLRTNFVEFLASGQGAVYAGYFGGLWRSLDSGATWSNMTLPDTSRDVKSIAVLDSFLYIGMDGEGLYRTADRGETWTRIAMTGVYGLHSIHSSQGVLWVGDRNGGVHRSIDDGKTWAETDVCGSDEVLSLAGIPSNLFAACDGGMFRSKDTGRTWNKVSDPELYALDLHFASVVADGNHVYAAGDGGAIHFPENYFEGLGPPQPPQINFGLGRQKITAVGSSGTRFYAGYDTRGYQGRTRGSYWERMQSYGYTTPSAYLPFAGRVLAATTGSGVGAGIEAITDADDRPFTMAADSGLSKTNVYALAKIGNILFAGSEKGVYRSTDSAKIWLPAIPGMGATPVRVLIAGGTTLFAGGYSQGLFRSADQGGSWTPLGAGLKNPVIALAYAGDVLVAAADSGREVFRSLDQGATWTRAQTGLTATWVRCLASAGTRLLAGTSQGVFRSLDGGLSWHPFIEGMYALGEGPAVANDLNITSLAVGGLYMVAGTARGTVWQRSVNDLVLSVAEGLGLRKDLAARRYFDPTRGTMVFESTPGGLKPRAVTTQGRRLPKPR